MPYLVAETLKLISQMFIQKFKNCPHDSSQPQGTQRKDKFTLVGLEGKYSVKLHFKDHTLAAKPELPHLVLQDLNIHVKV